jgi:hypothetical protein
MLNMMTRARTTGYRPPQTQDWATAATTPLGALLQFGNKHDDSRRPDWTALLHWQGVTLSQWLPISLSRVFFT